MPLESCTGGSQGIEIHRDPKTVDYSPRKRPEMHEITSFDDGARVVYRRSRGRNPPGTRKPWTIAHENGQKYAKSQVLMMPQESCTGGHGASKCSRDPKTVDYCPRKRPEMREIMSFDDAARVVYRGITGHRNPPGTQNRRLLPTKTARNA